MQLDLFTDPTPAPRVSTRKRRKTRQEKRREALRKEARKLLAEARREWRVWKTGRGVSHPEFFALVACNGWCGWMVCEGCIAADIRADELAAIEAGAEFLKSLIADLEAVA